MHVALVHDYLVERGGAEKVLAVLRDTFPGATIFTAVYDPATTLDAFRSADVRTSFLQRVAGGRRRYRALLPLYPLAFRRFDLSAYDLVITSSSGFAKSVRTRPDARHIVYCYTPPRFAWGYQRANDGERLSPPARLGLAALGPHLRHEDRHGAVGVDRFIAISGIVAARIADAYGRRATVLPPPIDCDRFAPASATGDFFLVLSRLVPYKRIDIAIEAFNRSGRPLLVAGDGRDRSRLESLARSNQIRFLGQQSDAEVRRLLATCRALIVTGEEDFGMAALEANASGRPVIAYGAGGALESVVPGVTGVTFAEQTPEALVDALERFDRMSFGTEPLVRHARRFAVSCFRERFLAIVDEELSPEREARPEPALRAEEAARS